MRGVGRYVLRVGLAAAMIAGCSAPVGQTASQSRALPATSSGNALLYASDWKAGEIFVFTYPAGTLVQTISDDEYPLGLCSDAGGNVWVMNFNGGYDQVVEFAHGGSTPIRMLDDPNSEPRGCSVDPLTGNLAVVNSEPPTVVVYPPGTSQPQTYAAGVDYPFACAYDAKGDLFVDGYHLKSGDRFGLAELPYGGARFVRVAVMAALGLPGNIQWDGSDLAVGDFASPGTIYRLKIEQRKKVATLAATVTLNGPDRQPPEGVEFWLADGTVVMPFGTEKNIDKIGFWSYPAGGYATGQLMRFGGEQLYGVTVSALPSR
jgi:hypothetical protein